MILYIIVLLLSLSLALFEFLKTPGIKNKEIVEFLLFSIFTFTAFTYGIGFDQDTYGDADAMIHLTPTEPLFQAMYYILGDPRYVRIATVFICTCLMGRTLLKHSPFFFFSMYIYVTGFMLMYSMGVLRQAIALSIIVSSWEYCYSNRIKFSICVIIAVLFHNSAIIAFLCLLVPKDRFFNKKELFLLSLSTVFIFVLFTLLLNSVAGSLLDMSGKLQAYTDDVDNSINILLLLYKLSIVLIIYLLRNNIGEKYKFYMNLYVTSIFLSYAFSTSSTLGGRLVAYFTISDLLILPILLHSCVYRSDKIVLGAFFLMVNGYLYFSFLNQFSDEYIPYKNWLFL